MILMYNSKYLFFFQLKFENWTHCGLNLLHKFLITHSLEHQSRPCLVWSLSAFKPISSPLCLAFYSQIPPSHCSFHSSQTLSSFLHWHLLFLPSGIFCPQKNIDCSSFKSQVRCYVPFPSALNESLPPSPILYLLLLLIISFTIRNIFALLTDVWAPPLAFPLHPSPGWIPLECSISVRAVMFTSRIVPRMRQVCDVSWMNKLVITV